MYEPITYMYLYIYYYMYIYMFIIMYQCMLVSFMQIHCININQCNISFAYLITLCETISKCFVLVHSHFNYLSDNYSCITLHTIHDTHPLGVYTKTHTPPY